MENLPELTEQQRDRLMRLLQLEQKTIARLERVAEEDERMEWLWALLRRIASTVAIILGSIVLFYEQLRNFVRGLLQ